MKIIKYYTVGTKDIPNRKGISEPWYAVIWTMINPEVALRPEANDPSFEWHYHPMPSPSASLLGGENRPFLTKSYTVAIAMAAAQNRLAKATAWVNVEPGDWDPPSKKKAPETKVPEAALPELPTVTPATPVVKTVKSPKDDDDIGEFCAPGMPASPA